MLERLNNNHNTYSHMYRVLWIACFSRRGCGIHATSWRQICHVEYTLLQCNKAIVEKLFYSMPIWRYSICNNRTWSSTESSDPLHKSIRNPRSRLAWLVPLWKRSLIARLTESINLRAETNLGVNDALELEISHKITLLLFCCRMSVFHSASQLF